MDATQASELPPGALTDDKRGTIVGVVIFLCLWSTLMVALRFWTRGVIIKQLGIDDYLCALGLVCAQRSNFDMPIHHGCCQGDQL
jgi:hypothetical protein